MTQDVLELLEAAKDAQEVIRECPNGGCDLAGPLPCRPCVVRYRLANAIIAVDDAIADSREDEGG